MPGECWAGDALKLAEAVGLLDAVPGIWRHGCLH